MANKFKKGNVLEVIKNYKLGKSITEISRLTNVSRSTIYRYINTYLDLYPAPATLSIEEIQIINEQAKHVLNELDYRDSNGKAIA